MSVADAIKNKKAKPKKEYQFLSTGSRLLNLALSGKVDGGFALGTYSLWVGDSVSGKTLMCHNLLAEAAISSAFDAYDLVYDVPEMRDFFDLEKMWGPKLAARIQPPRRTKAGKAIYSKTIEDFYYNLDDRMKTGRPTIFIEDSMAALFSVDQKTKFDENKTRHSKGQELVGSYGDGKAGKNSTTLRLFMGPLEKTNSLLVIVNQTRQNIGFGSQFNPKTWAGGEALKFYAAHVLLASRAGQIKHKDLKIGGYAKIEVKKNSVNGRERTIELPIYDGVGVDDIGSCIDFLIEQKHWKTEKVEGESDEEDDNGKKKKKAKPIVAVELGMTGKREQLVAQIEEEGMEDELGLVVQKVWDKREEDAKIIRKSRYQ